MLSSQTPHCTGWTITKHFCAARRRCLHPGGRLIVSCGGKGNAQDVFVALRPEMRAKALARVFPEHGQAIFFSQPRRITKQWLPRFGFETQTRETCTPKTPTYKGREGLATWLRTTWLPYVQRVPDNVAQASRLSGPGLKDKLACTMPELPSSPREEFIAAVTDRYLAKHPPDSKGLVHVRMVRLEIDAEKLPSM